MNDPLKMSKDMPSTSSSSEQQSSLLLRQRENTNAQNPTVTVWTFKGDTSYLYLLVGVIFLQNVPNPFISLTVICKEHLSIRHSK